MTTLRQTSFAAGELSPLLWGRTDLELFHHGARRCHDFLVSPQGAAVSRPGTELLVAAKTVDVVLVPYVAADETTYVLELGEYYLRVHHPSTGYTGVEKATPWRATELPELHWAQTGAVLVLTHSAHPPQAFFRLVVSGAASLELYPVSFKPGLGVVLPGLPDGASASFLKTDSSDGPAPVLRDSPATTLFVKDAAHPAREWHYKVAALLRLDDGRVVETVPFDVAEYWDGSRSAKFALPVDGLLVLAADAPVRIDYPAFCAAVAKWTGWGGQAPEFLGLVYYRGRGRLFGFIGSSRRATNWVDDGAGPNYQHQPRRGDSPFLAWEYPAACAFFQQRRVFAGSAVRPATLWLSGTDDWSNHDLPFPTGTVIKDAPLEFGLAGRRAERIRSLVAHARLLCFTDSSVWSAGGAGEALTSDSIEARLEDELGATALQPLVIDGAVLYVRAKGRGVRALTLDQGGAYRAQDITWHAEHLFRDYSSTVKSWCFQRDPWATIWAVRADGKLLSCTRTGAGVWAWAQHSTGVRASTGVADVVRSVVCVPEKRRDVVILAVTRDGTTYLERMWARDRETAVPITDESGDAAFALDSSAKADGAVGATFTVTGLAHLESRQVWAVAPGNAPQGPLKVNRSGEVNVGPFPTANQPGGTVRVLIGLPFTADLELLDAVAAGRTTQKTVTAVGFEVDSAQGLEVGEDFEHLVEWQQRAVADSYEFPSAASALAVVKVKGSWRRTGRAALRQAKPLPVTILGVTRELDVGGS